MINYHSESGKIRIKKLCFVAMLILDSLWTVSATVPLSDIVSAVVQHHNTHTAYGLTFFYRWLLGRLKCWASLFTQLSGATAEQAQTIDHCSPLSEWEEEWRPLDMATWSFNAPTSPNWEGHTKKERKGGVKGKWKISKRGECRVKNKTQKWWFDLKSMAGEWSGMKWYSPSVGRRRTGRISQEWKVKKYPRSYKS